MGYRQYDLAVLHKIQQEELVVLKEFVRICDKYSINYFAVFGTAIGLYVITDLFHGMMIWILECYAMIMKKFIKLHQKRIPW